MAGVDNVRLDMVATRGLRAALLVGLLALATPSSAQQPPVAPAEPRAEESEGERRNEVALVLAGTRERASMDFIWNGDGDVFGITAGVAF
jgi:hypothetical protein